MSEPGAVSLSEMNAALAERIQNTPNDPHVLDVELSAGFMSLMVWSDFLRMTKDERDFVFWLVEMMRAFEANGRMFPEPPAAPATLDELRANAKTQQGEPVAPVEPISDPEPDSFAGEPVEAGPGAGWTTHAETPTAGENPAPVAVFTVEVPTRKPLDLDLRKCEECEGSFRGQVGLAAHRRNSHGYKVPNTRIIMRACPDCGLEQRENELESHRRIIHHYTCPRCATQLQPSRDITVTGVCPTHGAVTIPALTPAEAKREAAITKTKQNFERCPGCGNIFESLSLHKAQTKCSERPNCPDCGKHPTGDRHGYWCNDCQKAVVA